MANTVFKLRRSSVAGKTPNTSTLAIGELALNLTDRKLYSSDGTNVWETGANLTTLSVSTNTNVNNVIFSGGIKANGFFGATGQVLTSNGSGIYWSTSSGGGAASAVRQQYTADGSTTSFTVSGGYDANTLSVYLNGVLLRNGTEVDVSSGSNFTISPAPANGALIDAVGYATVYSTTGLAIGNVDILGDHITVGNSSVNTQIYAGNVYLNGSTLVIGNTSTNITINSTALLVGGSVINSSGVSGNLSIGGSLIANGTAGLSSQVLTSNGSGVYWSSAGVNTNATYVWSNAHTFNGVVTLAQTAIGTVNNALYLNGTDLSTLQGQITSNASAAYANSVSYTDSKILTANSAITGNAATAYSNAVGYIDTKIGTVNSAIVSNASAAYSNAVSYTDGKILTANSAITGNAATAYSNAVSYTDSKILTANSAITGNAATAYTNAISYTDNKILTANSSITGNAATAYTNSTIFASNASNINSGTLAEARLPYRMDQNIRTTDTITLGNLTLTGNLYVGSNVNIIGANNLSIVDNMIYLNANNTVANPDLGFAGNYNDGTYHHAGFFRDASDSGTWKVFDNYLPEPDANAYIDTTNTTFHLANFQANTLNAGNTSTNWFIANTSGVYVTGTINTASYSIGTAFTANATVVNAVSFYAGTTLIGNTTGPYGKTESSLNVNSALTANNATNLGGTAASGYQTTAGLSANVATLTANNATNLGGITAASYQLNSTLNANIASYLPTYTGVVNGSSHTVSTSFVANATGVYHTGTINAASHTVGTAFTANSTVVNSVSYYAGTTLIGNTTGPYGKTESALNVNSALTSNNSSYLGGTIASGYQTTAGLSTNVATLTANNTSFVGSVSAANVVSNAQLSSNLSNYAALSGATFTGDVSANSLTANTLKTTGGTTATRPAGTVGMIRYNSNSGFIEAYMPTGWASIAISSIDYGTITDSVQTSLDFGGVP